GNVIPPGSVALSRATPKQRPTVMTTASANPNAAVVAGTKCPNIRSIRSLHTPAELLPLAQAAETPFVTTMMLLTFHTLTTARPEARCFSEFQEGLPRSPLGPYRGKAFATVS